ncbi:MAG: WXG100 family type VII secretion target [Pirellulales bacterium]
MSKAIVDPAELRRFAHGLKLFNSDLESRITALNGQMRALGQSWRDQEHEKFAAEFDETMAALARFVQVSEQHIPFLLRKAERIEEYLQQR